MIIIQFNLITGYSTDTVTYYITNERPRDSDLGLYNRDLTYIIYYRKLMRVQPRCFRYGLLHWMSQIFECYAKSSPLQILLLRLRGHQSVECLA